MLPDLKSHHMSWSGQLPLSNTFKCSSSVVEPLLCSGKPKVVDWPREKGYADMQIFEFM